MSPRMVWPRREEFANPLSPPGPALPRAASAHSDRQLRAPEERTGNWGRDPQLDCPFMTTRAEHLLCAGHPGGLEPRPRRGAQSISGLETWFVGGHPGWRKQLHPAAWGLGPSRAGGGVLWAGEGLPDLTLCLCDFGVWRDERGWQSPMREQNESAWAAPLCWGHWESSVAQASLLAPAHLALTWPGPSRVHEDSRPTFLKVPSSPSLG